MNRLLTSVALFALLVFAAGCGDTPAGDLDGPGEAAAPLSAQAQSALAVLPADARFLAVADAQALQSGGFFDDRPDDFSGELGARLKDFFDATGFDPERDVQKVYVAAGIEDGSSEAGAPQLAIAADFDRARFQSALEGEQGDRFEKETYRGQPLYRSTRSGDDHTFSFALTAGGLILLAPRSEAVRQMLDRLDGSGPSIADDEEAMRLADQVRGRGDTWFVARGLQDTPFHLDGSGDPQGRFSQIEKIIRSTAGAVSLSEGMADGELFLYTQDGADPDDLQEVLEGLVSMLQKRDELPAEKRRALESVEIERSGEAVHVSFSFPMSDA